MLVLSPYGYTVTTIPLNSVLFPCFPPPISEAERKEKGGKRGIFFLFALFSVLLGNKNFPSDSSATWHPQKTSFHIFSYKRYDTATSVVGREKQWITVLAHTSFGSPPCLPSLQKKIGTLLGGRDGWVCY